MSVLLREGMFFGGLVLSLWRFVNSEVYNFQAEPCEPPYKTSVIIPAFNEEYWIESCLQSLINQNVYVAYPEKFEFILVDRQSTDKTLAIAEKYVNRVVSSEKGKLNARDAGIKVASGEIIIAFDGDSVAPPNWLNLVVKKFNDDEVVAVATPRLPKNPMFTLFYLLNIVLDSAQKRMPGGNSAFLRSAYFASGGFGLDVNQLNRRELQKEEEYNFPKRLMQFGQYVYEFKAPVYTSTRHLLYSPRIIRRVLRKTNMSPEEKYIVERYVGERF